ncbi:MAG: hypothetical protein QOF10_6463 [Kribbellaceae bacterium]|nr:hypothetical protein [Kribbellaceae bacterium]
MAGPELTVRYSVASNEVDVKATRQAFVEVANLLEAGGGQVLADGLADPLPYEVCLPLLVVRRLSGGGVVIRVSEGMGELIIEGGEDGLRVLAGNLRGLETEGADDEHLHTEYFPGHFYLAESSTPAVVALREK